jgi:hypothetical protein
VTKTRFANDAPLRKFQNSATSVIRNRNSRFSNPPPRALVQAVTLSMFTPGSHSTDYRGWPATSDRVIRLRPAVAQS